LDEGDDPGLAHRAQLAGTPFRTTQAMPGYSAFLAEGWGSPAQASAGSSPEERYHHGT